MGWSDAHHTLSHSFNLGFRWIYQLIHIELQVPETRLQDVFPKLSNRKKGATSDPNLPPSAYVCYHGEAMWANRATKTLSFIQFYRSIVY